MDKIIVTWVFPPIPDRRWDWQASFDGDEPNDAGSMATGHGRTAAAAVLDLIDNHYRGVECSRDVGIT